MKGPWLAPLLLFALAGCHAHNLDYDAVSGGPATQTRVGRIDLQHALGRRIYNFRCYYCHGYSGDAHTLASAYLSPPPRSFTATPLQALSREQMLAALRDGRPGTAMQSFAGILSAVQMQAVTEFVRIEFMQGHATNTQYHTAENGWPDQQRYRSAFPFVSGAVAPDAPAENLNAEQQRGKQLYLSACVSCHDRGTAAGDALRWEGRPLSYPRNDYRPGGAENVDAISSASPYALHDVAPQMSPLDAQARLGETLFQANCAFCHAADGTGKNWIGSFMEPHPRNLTDPAFMSGMTRQRLRHVIRDGLAGTSMPAWKGVLTPPQIEAVIRYVSQTFHPLAP